ncbi:hypothetical protein ACFL1X_14905, partial [Candidatus Hydrogenedentota bacterium]
MPLSEWKSVVLTWDAPQVNGNNRFIVSVEALKSGKQVFNNYDIFRVTDLGGTTVDEPDTFKDTFDGGILRGFREHDTFWNISNGEYHQPEIRGHLVGDIPFSQFRYSDGTWEYPSQKNPMGEYDANYHMAAIDAWTFDDFNACVDVRMTETREDHIKNPFIGMGFRLSAPGDSPAEGSTMHRTGYYAGIRRVTNNGTWQLVFARTEETKQLDVLQAKTLTEDLMGQTVRIEVTATGNQFTVTANGDGRNAISHTDGDSMYSSGYATLVTSHRAAGTFDNVQIGQAPLAPWFRNTLPAQVNVGFPVTIRWIANPDASEYMVEWSADGFQTAGGNSGWTPGTQTTFTNLPAGEIEFRVYSRDGQGRESVSSQTRGVTVHGKLFLVGPATGPVALLLVVLSVIV